MDLKIHREPDPPPRTFRAFVFTCFAVTSFLLLVAAAARGDSGTWRLPVDRVDCVEIGKVYTGDGDLSLTQLVWWHQEEHGYEVVDWRLLKPGMEPHKVGGWWVVTWIDNGRLVRVHARSCYQSWLQHDSELARREHWPLDQRRKVGGW